MYVSTDTAVRPTGAHIIWTMDQYPGDDLCSMATVDGGARWPDLVARWVARQFNGLVDPAALLIWLRHDLRQPGEVWEVEVADPDSETGRIVAGYVVLC